jgi:predicted nucleic acid-binding Zn ribbon protein
MITYLYETIPATAGETIRHYEIQQAIGDAPLTRHPESGELIRRVVLGGFGAATSKSAPKGDCGCGPAGCC